jgi:hypothetical protein
MPFYQETKTARGAAIGTIMPWTGGLTSIPSGWIICDGQSISANDFPLLAQAIGDTYNAGNSDFDGNFPGYVGNIKMPNLNGKTLIDIESSYFADFSAGGTGRLADVDPKALILMDPIIGTNEDAGVTTIFTDVFVDLVFNINNDDRSGYLGRIQGNTKIDGEGFITIYPGPRKLGRAHIKRHTHLGSLETVDSRNKTKPGQGVIPYDPVYYTLFAQGTDNDGQSADSDDDVSTDEAKGVAFYFGWSDDEGWQNDSPAGTGTDTSNISASLPRLVPSTDTDGNEDSNIYGGIVAGRLTSAGSTGANSPAPQDANVVDTWTLQWPIGNDIPSGFGEGQPGKVLAKARSEQPPINMKPRYVTGTPLTDEFIDYDGFDKYISDRVPAGIGGNTVSIPEGFTNYYTTSDTTVGDTLVSNPGLGFIGNNESPGAPIVAHTHDEFDVSFDSSRMRPQSNLTASVSMPNATLDNVANRNALQIDFNIQQPRVTSIYIIRAY